MLFYLLQKQQDGFIVVLSSSPHSCGCVLFSSLRPPEYYRCPLSSTTLSLLRCLLLSIIMSTNSVVILLSHRTATITLSSLLHNHQPPPWLCCLPSSAIAITPTMFGCPSSSPGGLCHFPPSRYHHNFIVVLSCSPLYHSYRYVIFAPPPPPPQLYCCLSLFTTPSRLSCLVSSAARSRLCYLLFSTAIATKKLQKSCLGPVKGAVSQQSCSFCLILLIIRP